MTRSGDQLVLIGVIMGTHGLWGELRVRPENGDPRRFCGIDRVFLGRENCADFQERKVISERAHGEASLVLLEGVEDVETGKLLKGFGLYLPVEELPELPEDEFYAFDLVGLGVYAKTGERLGIVKEVIELPANDVFVVKPDSGREFLVPAVGDIVCEIDVAERRMIIDDRPGLR
ncbi:MAG TPA: ribosome maturation factor RimM [Bacillota bacterium]|nr:ribosome maturation factor RimM [Bacillota bacterium]HOK70927.1 ribosome maturation factor RimM [Bacillota bacterium]HOL51272.1 ribosome maturation factor RimM [Bacillota bacterium]HOO29563.1 ribosome maturation factor RimM [Bacillota bacterium]HPQ02872.1 ribosome maturation factor RimM [Bacillota bacterium]